MYVYEEGGKVSFGPCEKYAWRIKRGLMRSQVQNIKFTHILDAGCGGDPESGLLNYVTNGSKIALGLDVNIYSLKKAKSALRSKESLGVIEFVRGDAQNLPFKDECFDVITASEVIEHLQKAEVFLSECYRVCKNRGFLVLSTPNFFRWSSSIGRLVGLFERTRILTRNPQHIHEFTHFELIKLLKKHKFHFLELYFGALNPYLPPFNKPGSALRKENSSVFKLYLILNKFIGCNKWLEMLFKWDFIIKTRKSF